VKGDFSSQILTKVLDLTAARQRVLSHNLANINTPGFVRSDLDFSQALADAVRGGPKKLAYMDLEPLKDEASPARFDGNNVQLETELAEMSKNALMFQMAIQAMNARMATLRTAITGR